MGNPFVHVELQTNDVGKAKAFYAKLFDWDLKDESMPDGSSYTMIRVGEGTGGGMMQAMMSAGEPPHWLAYVGVDDVAAKTALAKTLGAKVAMDVMSVGDFGKMSVIVDPSGASLALWQALRK